MLPTPLKKNYTDTKALVKEIPQLKTYTGKSIKFKGSKVAVRIRRKALDKKPLLYLWDIDRACYLSSLFPLSADDSFKFEVGGTYHSLVYDDGIPQVQEAS